MKLTARTVLITGGTSGIGLELAGQLLERGNVVVVTGRKEEALAAARQRFPALHAIRSDVSDPDAIRLLYETVSQQFPRLNTLVNNAGLMRIIKADETRPLDDVTLEIDVDLIGPIRMVQQFLPHLLAEPSGLIVNVSSGLAFVPFPVSPVYSAAKAGLRAYTRCLRIQLENSGVRVVELAPPLTETPLFTDEFAGRMNGVKGMPVEKLVRAAIAGIEAGRTEIRPGQSNLLKIASRIAPELILRQLSKV